jgi:hypothetical protein
MSKDEVAAYLKRVESHDSPLYSPQAGAGFASNWRSGAYFKDTVVNILKNRFGDDWNIWKVQWPSYKIAIDGFLNNNPFYMFFPWDSANSAGKNQNDTDEIKGYVEGYFIVLARIIIEKIQNKTELHPAEQNFINGIIAYARGKTTNLTPVSRAKGSGKEEAGVPFSVAPFPLWQLPHDKKDPNDWEHFPVVGGRPSDLYGGAEYLGFGPSDVKDMLLKNSYDLNETGGKDDPPILDSIIQAIAFNEQWDILRQGGAAEDYVTGMYDNQYFGYTGILKKVTRDVGKLIKNHEEMPVDMKTVGARYFPYKKFPRNNTGPNVYLKKHWVIGRDLYDYTTEDPPGIPIDAFNLAVGADSNVSPSADIFNWAGDSGRGTLYKDAKYVAETRASGSQEIQHPLVQIYQEIYDFPKDILGTPGMDKWMEDLKEFGKFEGGKDITQYPFQYIPNSKVANTGAGGALEFWATWWAGEKEVSEQQRIKALIQGGWARMVIRGFNSEAFQTTVDEAYADLFNNNFLRNIYSSILKDKEVARRFSLFKYYVELSKELKDRPEDKQYIGSVAGDIEDANLEANDAWEEGTPPPPPVKKSKFGDAEDIEKRQKFFKQCALLLNMGELGSKLRAEIRSGASRHEKLPFGGRFWMMKCSENQEKLMGNLISPEDGKEFFNIPPSVVSYLTPKFRLFKVENEKEKGNLQETEFIFPAFTDINRKTNYKKKQNIQSLAIKPFLGNDFDKGDGFGLKEFSFEFNGTNPAESRNDIKATLKLYFQSFADFIRERVSTNGKTYRFVDLVIQPNPDSNSVNGVEIVHPNQYDPSFYRLRAEIGYNYPDNMSEFYDDPKGVLKKAINRTNRSYFLCMVDHDLDIDIDGTVTLSISYRAYVESLLKTLRFDALSSPELIRSQRDHRKKWESILNGKECSEDQLQEIKRAMSVKEDSLRKQTLRSIVSRLLADGKVYVTEVDPNHATDFRDYGTFFNGCDLNELTSGYSTVPSPSSEFPGGTAGFILQGDLPKNYDYRDINDVSVQYFFFGDLLYTIMDSMMDLDDKDKMAAGCENTKFILGSFDFVPYVNGKHSSLGMNIAEIPIALDYFMKWFTDNVITQGETRKSFPILTFIRNLVNNLLQKSLLETCVNKDLSKELRFQTGQVSAYHKGSDPLAPYYARDTKSGIFGNLVLDTDAAREQGLLPLAGDAESGNSSINNKINNFHNYLVLSTYGSTLTYTGKGKYKDDVKFGRYHIDIGSNKGIVKKVSFKKTDMQYILVLKAQITKAVDQWRIFWAWAATTLLLMLRHH